MNLLEIGRMAKVLIIDDDIHIANILREHLAHEGYEVLVSNTGADGLAAVFKLKPDVILLDVMLPDATGFQVCKEIRKKPSAQAIPIIMMSGVARYPNQKGFGLERGANEYILKPFEIVEVGELVHSYANPGKHKGSAPASKKKQPAPVPAEDKEAEDKFPLHTYIDKVMNRFKI